MTRPDGDGPTSLGTLSTEEVRPELGSLDLLAPAELVAVDGG